MLWERDIKHHRMLMSSQSRQADIPVTSSSQNGTLKIVDRKKHIFKLAQGEYIAPEKIENIYIRSEAVAQAFVHGDSLQVRRHSIASMILFSRIKTDEYSYDPSIILSLLSLQACLVAIIVPDPDFLPGWAKKRGLVGSYEELCRNKVLVDEYYFSYM